MEVLENQFQIFGSRDSQDVDIMVFVDKLATIDENHTFVKELNKYFETIYHGLEINCNLAVLKDGMIIDVFKGTYDECNNSLYYTYNNHKQPYSNVIEKLYERGRGTDFYHVKLKRVARYILSFFSREPELREIIKPALKGDLITRLEALKHIDFTKHTTFPKKKEKHEDIYKVVAFQFAQILGLSENKEIYTKDGAIFYNQALYAYIKRKELDYEHLMFLNQLLYRYDVLVQDELHNMKSLIE
jgi:hypothetical protein